MTLRVRQAAVLGSGVMGAQIAALLAQAGIAVTLYDLAGERPPRSGIAAQAIERLSRGDPPLLAEAHRGLVTAANYEDDAHRLGACDLIVEAIVEKFEAKTALFRRLAPHLHGRSLLATNTSGLSIQRLAEALPEAQRPRFCGVHFFNPPGKMKLVELIPSPRTAPGLLAEIEEFLSAVLGKTAVRAHDTPEFIANRVGLFAFLSALHHAGRFSLGLDLVDALTGPLLGRPRTATCGTLDLIGLDVYRDIVATMAEALTGDPWREYFRTPAWMETLIARGALGRKAGAGIYRKDADGRQVWDPAAGAYRPAGLTAAPEVAAIMAERDARARLAACRASDHVQARFLWAIQRDLVHYCAFHQKEISDSAAGIDLVFRWGFGWEAGPFESWQAAGEAEFARALEEDIAAGRAMARAPLIRLPPPSGNRESVTDASPRRP